MNFRKSRESRKSRRHSLNLMADAIKWRSSSKKVSLSLKDLEIFEDDIDDEQERPSITKSIDWEEHFAQKNDNVSELSDQDQEIVLTKKQTLILATLVPNELLLMEEYENSKKILGVLLMADVSGFTALSECYHNAGQGGAYRLTVTLNTYLGSLIELIYSHGGDVLKFAGDAFLALWKNDKKSYLCHTIHTVVACALIIQQSYASYETDVKVNLKVKLAISAGNLIFAPIGTDTDKNYVVTGLPVFEAKDAESVCKSGEVVLSPSAWGHCYSRNYNHIIHDDGHITIKSILYDPRDNNVSKPFGGFTNVMRQTKKHFDAIENLPNDVWDENITPDIFDSFKVNEYVNIREKMLESIKKNKGGDIRKFMIRPVVQQIDAHQPLEYLTEMRYVTIMFITLKPQKCATLQWITIVSKAYEITCEIVYKSMGCVNKIILFDKDVMILIIFGLRGFKHESEAQEALKSAYTIKKYVLMLDGVLQVSIGVTTGQVYCGVVGHPLRREFTVIGSIVNKAARLMCYFKNKITCDESTYIKSKLSANNFTLQPTIQLKGIQQTGKIYEYNEDIRIREIADIPIITPLLNRSDEMELFNKWINSLNYETNRDYDGLLIIGDKRVGKSRLLDAMACQGLNVGLNVCNVRLTSIHAATPYLALRRIVQKLLKVSDQAKSFPNEEKIVEIMKVYSDDLCYLNGILRTHFAYNACIYTQSEHERKEKTKQVFTRLISSINDPFIICVDDLHNLDILSWEFISTLLQQRKIFMVLTVTKDKINTTQTWLYNAFIQCNMKKVIIGPLKPKYIAPLACQILGVDAVPNDLCSVLETKCNCMPGIIETFIVHLFSNDALDVNKMNPDEMYNLNPADFQFPDSELLNPIALNSMDQVKLKEVLEIEDSKMAKICVVTNKNELNININSQNMDALVIMQIDSLTPYQQLLLKIASVIGTVFSRNLLENIMYENNNLITAKAIKRLFAMNLLSCANSRVRWNRKTLSVQSAGSLLNSSNICECSFDYDENNSDGLPKYAFCNLMRFKNQQSKTTCYELLPLNQKKEFHTRIINYLEQYKSKCASCGGVVIVVRSVVVGSIQKQSYMSGNFFSEFLIKENTSESIPNVSQNMSLYETKSDLINYNKYDNDDMTSKTTSITRSISNPSIRIIRRPSILKNHHLERRTTIIKRVTIPSILFKTISSQDVKDEYSLPKIRKILEAEDRYDWIELGLNDSLEDIKNSEKKKKCYKINLEKGTSEIDISKCTCTQLKILTYEELIHHALQADLKIKAVEFILEYCTLSIKENIINDVIEKLNEAEKLCLDSTLLNGRLTKFLKKIYLGKIYTMLSASNIMIGNYIMAKLYIEKALKIYKINLNKLSASFNIRNISKKYHTKDIDMIIDNDSVICLNIASLFYKNMNEDKLARISAMRALQILQWGNCNVIPICDAYSIAMKLELDRGYAECTQTMEYSAQLALKRLPEPVKANELFEIGKLFTVSFHSRVARGIIFPAIKSGFRALIISRFVCADNISMEIIPDLFYLFLSRKRIAEAVDLLAEIIKINKNNQSRDNEIWYYALCMDMILDAGFQLEYPGNIIRFAENVSNNGVMVTPGWRRLVVGIWTYCLRSDMDRKSKRWEIEAIKWNDNIECDSAQTSLFTALRLSEGMLESLSKKMDDLRKVVDLMELRSLAETELNNMENDTRTCRILVSRWYMLKSSCFKLSNRYSAAASFEAQAVDEAKKTRNYIELARIMPSESKYWSDRSSIGSFMDWQNALPRINNSWHNLTYKCAVARTNY